MKLLTSPSLHIKPSTGFFRSNRKRLAALLAASLRDPGSKPASGLDRSSRASYILLRGADSLRVMDDDQTYGFSQDRHVWWCTGVDQPGVYVVIRASDGWCKAYIPRSPDEAKYWESSMEAAQYLEAFDLDACGYIDEMERDLKEMAPAVLYVMRNGVNVYSGRGPLRPRFPWLEELNTNREELYGAMNEVKLRKSEEEIRLMRESARIATGAHLHVMKHVRPGMNEKQAKALFRGFCQSFGPDVGIGYPEICASGPNAAIVHYMGSQRTMNSGDMVILDAGTKINGYNSDITSTFPVGGKFTRLQKGVYDVVLQAHQTVSHISKAGVNWQDIHITAEKKIIEGLLALGILKLPPIQVASGPVRSTSSAVEYLWESRISYYFFPHGIGHYLGTYVHDPIGLTEYEYEQKRDINRQTLRVHRTLEEGMVLTNEPGVYFNASNIDSVMREDASVNEWVDWEVLDRYRREVSGVRIEDMIVIGKNGCEGLSGVPKSTSDIESWMNSG